MVRFFFSFFALFAFALTSPAGVIVVGKLSRSTQLQPGEAFEGIIQLKNNDAQPGEVRIFQTDYLFQADGSNDYGPPGVAARSNAGWLTVSPTRVKLAPGETLPVRYKGRAPMDAKLRGSYWSMIMVEPIVAPTPAPEGKSEQPAMGLKTTVRFGIQIVCELGKGARCSLKILDKALTQEGGKRLLQLDVGNDGEGLLIPTPSVELFNASGVSAGKFESVKARVYPACSIRAKFDLTKLPPGKYTAMVLLDSGDAQVMGAQYDVVLLP